MDTLLHALSSFIDPISSHRAEAEQFLLNYEKSPESCTHLLSVLNTQSSHQIHHVACILLRRSICAHWPTLPTGTKSSIQSSLLSLVTSSQTLVSALSDVIAVIAAATIPSGSWPELPSFLVTSLSSPNPIPALHVLKALLDRSGGSLRHQYVNIARILADLTSSSDIVILSLVLSCFSLLIDWLDSSKAHKQIVCNFVPLLIKLLPNFDLCCQVFDVFEEIISSPVKFMKKPALFQLFCQVVNCSLEVSRYVDHNSSFLNRLCGCVQMFFESKPYCFSKSGIPNCNSAINLLFGIIESKNIYSFDDQNSPSFGAFLAVSAFAENVSLAVVFPVLESFCQTKMKGDVMARVAATSALGLLLTRLIVEGDSTHEGHLLNLFDLLISFLRDSDPQVTSSALNSITLMAESFSELEEGQLSNIFIKKAPIILTQTRDLIVDSRNKSFDLEWRCWSVVEHLVEISELSGDFLSSIYEPLAQILIENLQRGIASPLSLVHNQSNLIDQSFKRIELLFSTLSSFSSVVPHLFARDFVNYLNLINFTLSNSTFKSKGSEVVGRSIEFLGILLSSTYSKVPESREYIISILESATSQALSLLTSVDSHVVFPFVLVYIARLIEVMGEKGSHLFDKVENLCLNILQSRDQCHDDVIKELKNSKSSREFKEQGVSCQPNQQVFDLVDDDSDCNDSLSARSFSFANELLSIVSCISTVAQHSPVYFKQKAFVFAPLISNCLNTPFPEVITESIKCLCNLFICQGGVDPSRRQWRCGQDGQLPAELKPFQSFLIENFCEMITDHESFEVADCALECLRELLGHFGPLLLNSDDSMIDLVCRTVNNVLKAETVCQSIFNDDDDDCEDQINPFSGPLRNLFDSACDVIAALVYSCGHSFSGRSVPLINQIITILTSVSDMEVLATCVGVLADFSFNLAGVLIEHFPQCDLFRLIHKSLTSNYEVMVRNGAVLASGIVKICGKDQSTTVFELFKTLQSLSQQNSFETDTVDNLISSLTSLAEFLVPLNLVNCDEFLFHIKSSLPLKKDLSEDSTIVKALLNLGHFSTQSKSIIFDCFLIMLTLDRPFVDSWRDFDVDSLKNSMIEFIKCFLNNLNQEQKQELFSTKPQCQLQLLSSF
ncbi:hypothetical protein P9112_005679 [Eukaryota sp. TZLM1-RC]